MPTNSTATPQSANAYTGRLVAIVTLIVGFVGAAAPVVGDLDLTSTAGVVAGIGALTAIAVKYLEGWQRYEGRVDALQIAALGLTASDTPAVPEPGATFDPGEPGETFDPAEPDPDAEPADIPSPPDDDEIDAVVTEPAPRLVANAPPAAKAATANGKAHAPALP